MYKRISYLYSINITSMFHNICSFTKFVREKKPFIYLKKVDKKTIQYACFLSYKYHIYGRFYQTMS